MKLQDRNHENAMNEPIIFQQKAHYKTILPKLKIKSSGIKRRRKKNASSNNVWKRKLCDERRARTMRLDFSVK